VAERLAASQEGLSFMELVIIPRDTSTVSGSETPFESLKVFQSDLESYVGVSCLRRSCIDAGGKKEMTVGGYIEGLEASTTIRFVLHASRPDLQFSSFTVAPCKSRY
jgi:hypothetical protein